MYKTIRLNLEKTQQLDELAKCAGELYTRTVITYWRLVRKKQVFLSQYGMEKLCISNKLHAHTSDAIVGNFYSSIKSAKARKKSGSLEAKYPRRRKYFYKITWKSAAIKIQDGSLYLSNGKGNPALVIPWQWDKPKQVEIGWKKGVGYQLRATYLAVAIATPRSPYDCEATSQSETSQGEKVAAIDQGEVRTATVFDGEKTVIYSGRLLRSKVRYRAKTLAKLDALISKTKRGSKRRKYLVATKHRIIRKLDNQINDILHKQSTHLVSTLFNAGVQTVVIGDIRNIRDAIKYGAKVNQKLHCWSFGKYRWMIDTKLRSEVVF